MVNLMANEHETTGKVERATEFSEDVIQALEANGRAAVEAVGRFLVSVEEALPQAARARGVEKKITKSAVEMVQQLVETQSEFLVKVVDSAAKSLSRSEDEK
jgi:hypothetical protein